MTNSLRTQFYTLWLWLWLVILTFQIGFLQNVHCQETTTTEFAPQVAATCKLGTMNIKVHFNGPYSGAVHARDYRNSNCMVFGNGSDIVTLSLNLLAKQSQPDFCGVLVSNVKGDRSEERSIQLAVRVHKTLELADDKFYVITCGKTGYARDDNTNVVLKFLENNRRVRETVYGHEYTIKAEVTKPNGTYGIKVGNCFAFDKKNFSISLIDDRGCPLNSKIMTKFVPNSDGTSASAVMKSMFKFPEGSEVHLQCDIGNRTWNVAASSIARNTHNPIRSIVENLKIEPCPDKPLIALSIGDPTIFGNLVPPKEVIEAMQESVRSQQYNGYAPASGYQEAKEAVARYSSVCDLDVRPEDVILCSGCSCAIDLSITVLANPGQTILVPCPGFSIYRTLAEGLGINVKTYRLRPEKNWEIDLDDLSRNVDRDTVAIVVNNPSNPCGSVYSAKHLMQLLEVARRHRVPIIADEIYEHLVFPGNRYHPLASLSPDVPVLSCSGLTKRFLVPGWRMGWIIIHGRNNIFGDEIRRGLQNLSMRIIGSNTLVQGSLARILQSTPETFFEETIQTLYAHSKLAFRMLSEIPGLKPYMPQGAMYMMVGVNLEQFPTMPTTLTFVEALISEESVFCLPGECFGLSGYIRLVMTVPEGQIKEACHRISLFCHRHFREASETFSLVETPAFGLLVSVDPKQGPV